MSNILVLCTGNSCRSQMAHGFLEFFNSGDHQIFSAGVETHGLNPNALLYMKEAGIDISNHTSNHITEYQDIPMDYVITVCDHAKEVCPYFHEGAEIIHHPFRDPSKSKTNIESLFREVRDEIKAFCQDFIFKIENSSYATETE